MSSSKISKSSSKRRREEQKKPLPYPEVVYIPVTPLAPPSDEFEPPPVLPKPPKRSPDKSPSIPRLPHYDHVSPQPIYFSDEDLINLNATDLTNDGRTLLKAMIEERETHNILIEYIKRILAMSIELENSLRDLRDGKQQDSMTTPEVQDILNLESWLMAHWNEVRAVCEKVDAYLTEKVSKFASFHKPNSPCRYFTAGIKLLACKMRLEYGIRVDQTTGSLWGSQMGDQSNHGEPSQG